MTDSLRTVITAPQDVSPEPLEPSPAWAITEQTLPGGRTRSTVRSPEAAIVCEMMFCEEGGCFPFWKAGARLAAC